MLRLRVGLEAMGLVFWSRWGLLFRRDVLPLDCTDPPSQSLPRAHGVLPAACACRSRRQPRALQGWRVMSIPQGQCNESRGGMEPGQLVLGYCTGQVYRHM